MARKQPSFKPPALPKVPAPPTQEEIRIRALLIQAIEELRVVRFTYSTDNHQTWRECYPCKVGTTNAGHLTFEGYNPAWVNAAKSKQVYKLFRLSDMLNVTVTDKRSSGMLPPPYTSDDSRFSHIDACIP